MSHVNLSGPPENLTVFLTTTGPMAGALTATEPWPAPPELLFEGGVSWTSTLSDDGLTAAWVVPAVTVAQVLEGRGHRLIPVTLRDPSAHWVYATGTVSVRTAVGHGDPSAVEPEGNAISVETFDGQVHIHYHTGGSGGLTLTPDPDNPGLYILTSGGTGGLVPDPENPGLYVLTGV